MKQKKTVLNTQETPIIQKPTGVDTTGVQKTPELMATQKVSTFTPAPVAGLDGQFKTTADITAHKVNVNPQDAFNKARERGLAQMARNPQPGETPPPTGPFDTGNGEMSDGTTKVFDTGNGEMSDGTTKTPTAETPPTTPPTTAEKTTVTTPEGTTTTTTETPKPTAITKDTNWQDVQNKDLNSLEQLVEARYGTVATQENGKLKANVGGKNFEWSLQNGQPVKTEIKDPVTTGLFNKYITASSDEIYNGLINGEIPSSIETQITSNPNYAIAKEKYRKKVSADNTNKITETVFNAVTGTEPQVKDEYQKASDKIVERERAKGKTDAEIIDYASFLGEDKELTRYTEDLNAKNKQYNELQNIAQNNAKNIMKANPGITETSAILLATRQNEPLNQQMESLSYEIQNLQANINYREKINEVAYNERQQLAQEQRQFDRTLELQKQQQLLQTGDLNSTDPYIQQRGIETAVNQLYSQYPIPGMESPTAKIEKVKQMIAQGMTPQQAISQLEQEIRATDRYKNYINPPTQTDKPFAVAQGSSVYDPETKTWSTAPIQGTTKSTGNIVSVTAGNKTVYLDEVGANSFQTAFNQLEQAGIPIVTGKGYRAQVETIKEMATRYNIPFTTATETAQKLRNAGHQVADPGKSNHETGMAIDVYGDSNLGQVSKEQEAILNANGWFSAGIPGDAGHFEYKGFYNNTPLAKGGSSIATLGQFLKDNQSRGPGYSEEDVKAFDAKIDRFIANGDETGMALAFRNNLMNDKSFKEEFDNTKKFTVALDNVQQLINDYEKAGKSTNALNALAEKMYRKLGVTKDVALAQLQTQMGFTLANYIKSISGTAASDAEVQRLMGNMANIGNVKELNTAIVSQVKDNALLSIKGLIDNRMYGMPEDLKPKVFGDIYGQTTQTQGETLAPGIDPMGKVPTKQGEFTNQDLLDTYNELLKDNTPQEVDQYFSEYFGIPITR